jgi:hypothetical protein
MFSSPSSFSPPTPSLIARSVLRRLPVGAPEGFVDDLLDWNLSPLPDPLPTGDGLGLALAPECAAPLARHGCLRAGTALPACAPPLTARRPLRGPGRWAYGA